MKRLVVIDGHNQAFRHYFGAKEGREVAALDGLARVIEAALFDDYFPYMAVVVDHECKSWRSKLYPAYKAHRPARPDDLESQVPALPYVCKAYGVACVSSPGFEADDIIGSLVGAAEALRYKSVVVSSDKDLLQLVSHNCRVGEFGRKFFSVGDVSRKFGVLPHQIPEYLAIVGDPADNIPGIRGIGPGGAVEILRNGRTIKQALEELPDNALLRRLRAGLESARLSYRLAKLSKVPVPQFHELKRPQVVWSEAVERFNAVKKMLKALHGA